VTELFFVAKMKRKLELFNVFWEYVNENIIGIRKIKRNKNRNSGKITEQKRELLRRKIRNVKVDFYFHLARSAVINFDSRNPQL